MLRHAVICLAVMSLCACVHAQERSAPDEYMIVCGHECWFVVTIFGDVVRAEGSRRLSFTHKVSRDGRAIGIDSGMETRGALELAQFALQAPVFEYERRLDDRWSGYVAECTEIAPGGRTFAFIGRKEGKAGANDGGRQVYSVDLESGVLHAITRFDGSGAPIPTGQLSWSPDGSAIAFYWAPDWYGTDASVNDVGVGVVTLDGRYVRLAEPCENPPGCGGNVYIGPLWSPDSSRVFFTANYETDDQRERLFPHTYCAPRTGGSVTKVCDGTPTSISPDGRWLYATDRRGLQSRVDLLSGLVNELDSEWREARVSLTGRYVATLPPYYGPDAPNPGGGIRVFEVDGRLVVSVPQTKFGPPFGAERLFWVYREAPKDPPIQDDGIEPRGSSPPGGDTSRETTNPLLLVLAGLVVTVAVGWLVRRRARRRL